MPWIQTRDILNLSRDFYRQMHRIYDELTDHNDLQRMEIFLSAICRHVEYLEKEIRWWHERPSEKPIPNFTARIQNSLRLVAGLLGPILEEYGFLIQLMRRLTLLPSLHRRRLQNSCTYAFLLHLIGLTLFQNFEL